MVHLNKAQLYRIYKNRHCGNPTRFGRSRVADAPSLNNNSKDTCRDQLESMALLLTNVCLIITLESSIDFAGNSRYEPQPIENSRGLLAKHAEQKFAADESRSGRSSSFRLNVKKRRQTAKPSRMMTI
jgi:hypothetical protein